MNMTPRARARSAGPNRARHGGDHGGPDGHVHRDKPGDGGAGRREGQRQRQRRSQRRQRDASVLSVLTDREREVLARVAAGMSNDEIGAALFMSPLTAKTHVNRTMAKLGARDRAQLVVIAYETGLVRAGLS